MALKFRRGTTAQKSGSLAFGEPYVNTTLGTLQIGGPDGDITLGSTGTGSTGNFGAISGSGLNITGNAKIDGNLTLGGQLTIGDATTDTVNVVASLSSSLIPSVTNAFDLGSETKFWRDLYISTGSIKFVGAAGTVVGTLTNAGNGLNLDGGVITNGNSSFGTSSVSVTSVTGSLRVNGNVVVTNGSITGSLSGSVHGIGDVSEYSASVASKITSNSQSVYDTLYYPTTGLVASISSSINQATSSLSASFYDSIFGLSPSALSYSINLDLYGGLGTTGSFDKLSGSIYRNIYGDGGMNIGLSGSIASTHNMFSTSVNTQINALNVSASALTISASSAKMTNDLQDGKLAAIEAESGSYARRNSTNTFNGNQTISGSLIVTQDLTILGSSSIQNISSSTLNIGTNLITVAVNKPSVRFGGLSVIDSGSVGASGSFLYDSVEDEFIFVHKGNGTNVTSSHFILGPETIDNLGNETYLTNNRLPKGTGKEHLVDSNITDSGSIITLGSNSVVSGSLTVTGSIIGSIAATNGVVSGSSQLAPMISASLSAAHLNSKVSGIVSGSSQIDLTATTNYASGILTRLQAVGVVSGSAQITAGSTTNFATDVKTQLNSNTVISGSSQVAHDSTTGYSANRHIDHTAVSISAGSGLTGGGDISATRTLSIATGGVTNAMLVNSTISGVSLGSNLATLTIGSGLSGTSYNGSGAVTIANTGVTSNVAGTGVSVSGATGAVTISIGQAVATSSNVQFNSLGIGMAASATAGRIDATNDVVAFSSSDIRFKENIKPIENALDKISKISGNTYDWKEENKIEHGYEGNDVGVIAQEIEAVLPQLVQTRESGYKAVKYDKLVALLIQGIKEQQIQIDELKAKIGL